MAQDTKIEWTDATWNPIRGCSRVSEGCRHCYAETVAYRFSGPGQAYEGLVQIRKTITYPDGVRIPQWNGQIKFVEEHLLDPLKWKPVEVLLDDGGNGARTVRTTTRSRRIFVNSMSDLFHENVTDEMRDRIFAVMALCPQHTFQVLTKRPERMREYISAPGRASDVAEIACEIAFDLHSLKAYKRVPKPANATGIVYDCGAKGDEAGCKVTMRWPLPNVWLGVSAENQEVLNARVWPLLQTPAAVRFLSAEPLLGSLDLNAGELLIDKRKFTHTIGRYLDWVICGGESGPGARPMHPDWARSLRDQCAAVGVPFFFKQWGEWGPYRKEQNQYGSAQLVQTKAGYKKRCTHVQVSEGGTSAFMQRVGKKAAGHLLDGVEHHAFPEVRA